MSVYLFNAMIDLLLASLGPELGPEVGGVRVNHHVFVDDIALIPRSSAGLQALADDLATSSPCKTWNSAPVYKESQRVSG